MTDENLAALKRLELIHEYIYNECEGNIFYPPEHNRVIFLRIKNAADMLLNKAVKILKQQRLPHYGQFRRTLCQYNRPNYDAHL